MLCSAGSERDVHKSDLHAMLTVSSPDGILHVGTYTSESDVSNQVDALIQACGAQGPLKTKLVATDNPEILDSPAFRQVFISAVVAGDPIHVALNAEKVSAGHKTAVSKCLRACVVKLRHGLEDGRPYFTATAKPPRHASVESEVTAMSRRAARGRVSRIENNEYPGQP